MNLKTTKQPIMGLAALLILCFHLLPIPRSGGVIAHSLRYIVTTAYIGVDIFFFLSGYMAFFSDTDSYLHYIRRKFLRIYPIFLLSCVIAMIMGRLSVKTAWLTLLGLELFTKGGGSFLWFVPAIMLFYLAAPLYGKLTRRLGKMPSLLLTIAAWTAVMLVLERVTDNHSANIFLCRIPVILLGFAAAQYEGKWRLKHQIAAGLLLLSAGMLLTWKFGYMTKAHFPVSDIFYLLAIPHALGTILLSDAVFSVRAGGVSGFLGKISLELYCFQMVFGAVFFEFAIRYIDSAFLSFGIVFFLVLILSYLAGRGRSMAEQFLQKKQRLGAASAGE